MWPKRMLVVDADLISFRNWCNVLVPIDEPNGNYPP